MKVEQLTCTIGAEVSGVSLGDASRDAGLADEIKALLLRHKVLFFRDQGITAPKPCSMLLLALNPAIFFWMSPGRLR